MTFYRCQAGSILSLYVQLYGISSPVHFFIFPLGVSIPFSVFLGGSSLIIFCMRYDDALLMMC